jgi:hypothetical protein
MPAQFHKPQVECRCPDGHEVWVYDRDDRAWRRRSPEAPAV